MDMEIELESDSFKSTNNLDETVKSEYNLTVPILLLESTVKEEANMRWEQEDLLSFFNNFGRVLSVDILYSKALIVFQSFVDAATCLNFFKTESLYSPDKFGKISIRFYNQKEDEKLISEIFTRKMNTTSGKIVENINTSMLNAKANKLEETYNSLGNLFEKNDKEHISTNSALQYKTFINYCLSPNAKLEFKSLVATNKKRGVNILASNLHPSEFYSKSFTQESKNEHIFSTGKLYCKFYVQIENEPGFQISKRLLGAKGCNIKRIIEFCSKNTNGQFCNDAVKIRLRGKGSGYKEGPYNRESDEKLYLMVTSKYMDKYRKACTFVQELLINVYEEYKRYCERNAITPNNNLTIQKLEYISSKY